MRLIGSWWSQTFTYLHPHPEKAITEFSPLFFWFWTLEDEKVNPCLWSVNHKNHGENGIRLCFKLRRMWKAVCKHGILLTRSWSKNLITVSEVQTENKQVLIFSISWEAVESSSTEQTIGISTYKMNGRNWCD